MPKLHWDLLTQQSAIFHTGCCRALRRTAGATEYFLRDGKRKSQRLADDTANRLQGRELLTVSDVQGLVGDEVFGGQNLSTSGAHLTVQLSCCVSHCGRHLPGVLLVLVFLSSSSARLFLHCLAVSVGCQELLLLASVWQEYQQLVEDAVKVVSEQVFTAAVVLGC